LVTSTVIMRPPYRRRCRLRLISLILRLISFRLAFVLLTPSMDALCPPERMEVRAALNSLSSVSSSVSLSAVGSGVTVAMTAVKDARRLSVNGGRLGNCYAVAIGIIFDMTSRKPPFAGLFRER